jgi:6-phosphofructokinase 1
MAKRIAILTGGGDCPGLNAVLRAVVKHAHNTHGWDVVGIEDGFEGLYERRWSDLQVSSVTNLLERGGTILGSSNRGNPFSYPLVDHEGNESVIDVSDECVANLETLDVEALIVVGGDGTMGMARKFMDKGVKVVGVPKTIDNDLEATDYTVGFQTAVEVACDALDRLHTTAESHDRVIICEVMGRYAGWIALEAGLAGGADVILIPEIEYDDERIIRALDRRRARKVTYSLAVVAEGAVPAGGGLSVREAGDATRQERLGGAGNRLASVIRENSDYDVRVTVLGHIQRGGRPCAFDRVLATRFGTRAVDLVAAGRFGECVALRDNKLTTAPIDLAVAKLKRVDPMSDRVRAARATGVEMGA